jgi:glycosyltransferase involved in cell wall biosynthesis
LNITGENNFLWVGRLNGNKDPITVINAFEKYLAVNKPARLYMIYQTEELIEDIQMLIAGSEALKNAVFLIGKIDNKELDYWYNGADFYISGSHSEGSGYALVEAMACGCIPVVTAIPSFKTITGDGEYGILFEPGNIEDLYKKLLGLEALDKEKYSRMVHAYAAKNLSYKAVADQIYQLSVSLITK